MMQMPESPERLKQIIMESAHDVVEALSVAQTDNRLISTIEQMDAFHKSRHPDSPVDIYRRIETVKTLCEQLQYAPRDLTTCGERLYLQARPVIDAWLTQRIAQTPALVSKEIKGDIRHYSDAPPVSMVNAVYALNKEIDQHHQQQPMDRAMLLVARLCKRWDLLRQQHTGIGF